VVVNVTDGSDGRPDDEPGEPRERAEAPLADLAERVGERRERAGSDEVDALFEAPAFESVEADSVWEDPDDSPESEFGAVGSVVDAGDRTYVVSTRNFCERCRFFSAPPRAQCTHDGTEIREFVDKDSVRVSDCPIVEERGRSTDRPPG